jgi:CHAT domain-containing protein
MPRRWISWSAAGAAVILAAVPAIVPARAASNLLATSQTAAATQTDPMVQVDDLIAQCEEQMNVNGRFDKVAELALRALALSRQVGDKVKASTAMVYLSAAYAYQGRLAEARDVAEQNLVLARETGNRKTLEQALNTAAGVLGESGRYEEAIAYLYQCLEVAREISDTNMQYMSLLNIGEAYVRSGDPEKADLPLHESLRIAGGLNDGSASPPASKKATEMALLNLGAMESARGRYRAALKDYERVHASRPQSPLWVITALIGMADAHEHLGEPRRAIEWLHEALPLAQQASSGLQYVTLMIQLGVNQELVGDLDDALATENDALAVIHRNGGDADREWQVEARIAHVQRALGHNGQAQEHYGRAIAGIERLRATAVNTEQGRAGVLARSSAAYAESADVLHDLDRTADAFATAESGRARAFLDILAEARVGLADELSPEQHQREAALLTRISAAQKKLWSDGTSTGGQRTFDAALSAAEQDLEALHAEIRQQNPRYASLQYPQPVDLQKVQRGLLDDRTALIEYLVGDQRSLAWIITRDNIEAVVLPARSVIDGEVTAFRKALVKPVSALTVDESLNEVNRAGGALYRSVLRPLQPSIAFARRLIIVPDGVLDYVPFEALVTGSKRTGSGEIRLSYLAERVAVVYGPSASALLAVQAMNTGPSTAKSLLAVADPLGTKSEPRARSRAASIGRDYTERGFSLSRLPYAREEVLAIARLFPRTERRVLLGTSAREETLKTENLQGYRFIHFATHGFLDERKPGRSGILLSREPDSMEDGILQVGEITRLKMDAELVTLSACSTGVGKLINGEGVLGLTRAMFYAGARNVAVSLWNVNDSATAALMTSFYGHLKRGLSEDEALRLAKLGVLHNQYTVWRHPYYWAAFVLEGEGR